MKSNIFIWQRRDKVVWLLSVQHYRYNDVTMSAMASQITSLTIVYSNRLFRRRSKKASYLHVTGFCEGDSPVTVQFPAQRASNAENVSNSWRHHDYDQCTLFIPEFDTNYCYGSIIHFLIIYRHVYIYKHISRSTYVITPPRVSFFVKWYREYQAHNEM